MEATHGAYYWSRVIGSFERPASKWIWDAASLLIAVIAAIAVWML
jgi:hypothetical protein